MMSVGMRGQMRDGTAESVSRDSILRRRERRRQEKNSFFLVRLTTSSSIISGKRYNSRSISTPLKVVLTIQHDILYGL